MSGRMQNKTNAITPNKREPTTLNIRWIQAARFPVLEVPTLEIRAVTQEPIFCPRVIYMAALVVTTPLRARVCKIPTEADEL